MWVTVVVRVLGPERVVRWVKIAVVGSLVTCMLGAVVFAGAIMTTAMSAQRLLLAAVEGAPVRQCRTPTLSLSNPGGSIWNGDQHANAAAIVEAGAEMGVPAQGWVIAVATAMQESTLLSLDHGDAVGPDSRGLFQQRTSWGPESVRMDPKGAARLFYARLLALAGWESMPLSHAAQAVQVSAYPDAYAKWEDDAQALVGEVTGGKAAGAWCRGATGPGGWALPLDAEHVVPPMKEHHDYPAVDIGVAVGAPVYAMTAGTVRVVDQPGGCGAGVAVTTPEGHEWIYCHASQVTASGGAVVAGQQIMLSGGAPGSPGAGSSTGPHLHVQLRVAGSFRCVGDVIDALALGQPAPAVESLKAAQPCVKPPPVN